MFNFLVSAFNCEKYLEECLGSIVAQNVKCDIILINPRPTEAYIAIKQKFIQNIHFSIEEPDDGCADGLNKCLKFINNPYVCVLNGDDYLLRNSLNIVVKELETKPEILIGNGFIVDSNNYLIKEFKSEYFSSERLIKGQGIVCHQSTFYNRKIFEEGIKFNKHNTTTWDAEILLEAYLKNYKFKYINNFIGALRIHSESLSGMKKNKKDVLLQQSLYFERVRGRKITIFDKIWIFIISIVFRIKKTPKKIKEIFKRKVKII